jgi:SAM-dependent methyltransferase
MSTDPGAIDDQELIPPADMLFDGSSSPRQFVDFGEGFVHNFLVPRAGLRPSDVFFDLGCGNGSVARALTRYLVPPGRYEGMDINGQSVTWLEEHYRKYPGFRFTHANVYNKMYNPAATVQASQYRLPYADGTFTAALLKSVFTHMLPADVRHYLKELGRVMAPGGRVVITYFLLNDESRELVRRERDEVKMRADWEGDPLCRVASTEVPESATAHDEARIRAYTAEAGFTVLEIAFGNWCGRPSLLGLQDAMIITKT